MPERGEQAEENEMTHGRNYFVICFMIFALILSISCLVASAFIDVDRGDVGKSRGVVYNDFPKKDFHPVTSEELPCADVDEYDTFNGPNSGDISSSKNEHTLEENYDVPDSERDEIGGKKDELKSKKIVDADVDVEDSDADDHQSEEYEDEKDLDSDQPGSSKEETDDEEESVPSDFYGELDKSFNNQGHSLREKPIKRRTRKNHSPSKLFSGNVGHHKVRVKLKNFESPGEEVKKLERVIERIAEGDETSRKIIHRKRNELKSLIDHKADDPQNMGNDNSDIQSTNDEIDEGDPKSRESRKRSPEQTLKQEPESEDGGLYGSRRKKRFGVLEERHLPVTDESFASLAKRDAPIDVDDWGYCGDLGPEKWQEKWPDCGGIFQSPINLDTTVAKIDYEPILKWKGFSNTPSKMTLINNGHSVILTTSYEDCGSRPYIWDSRMNHEYVFGELTFHWGADESSGSEHTLNFMKYPLEMQVIHYRRELGSIEKAQEVPGGIVIVGILYRMDAGKRQNQGIADLQSGFSKIHDGPSSTTIQPFPMSRIIPQFSKHYMTYNGSMTTPPCTETVIWIMHLKPATISKKQLAKFHKLKNDGLEIKQNNRPIQKTNKRCIIEVT